MEWAGVGHRILVADYSKRYRDILTREGREVQGVFCAHLQGGRKEIIRGDDWQCEI